MIKVTFPIHTTLQGDTLIKHTYGNVRKLVKSILKLSEFSLDTPAYRRHLNKLYQTLDHLDTGFKSIKNGRDDENSYIDWAEEYKKDLERGKSDSELVRILLRGVNTEKCTPLEKTQVDLLRYAIQDDGFYMPEAMIAVEKLLKETT